ncbi:MAG TPA: hypothetical protein VLL07_00460, partial [Pontiella sp.]|nr:hypothetical protein [Pontiella sp.]
HRDVKNTLTPEEQERVGLMEVIAVNTEPTVHFTGSIDKQTAAVTGALGVAGLFVLSGGAALIALALDYGATEAVVGALIIVVGGGVVYGVREGASEEDIEWMKRRGRRAIKQIKAEKYLPAAIARQLGNPEYMILRNINQLAVPEITYAESIKSGKNSVLEVTVEKIDFNGVSEDASVGVTARVRLRLLPDGKVICDRRYYRSSWGDEQADLHKKVLTALDKLSDAIVKDVNPEGATPGESSF